MLTYLNPLTYLKWIGQFFYAWGMSMPWATLPKAIPALILILVLAVTTAIALTGNSNNWRGNLLKKQLTTALDTDDFETAELLLTRQVNERPNDGDLNFRLAMIQDQQGKTEEATRRMRRLVNAKRHRQAARWIVTEKYNSRKWNELDATEQEEFGQLTELMYNEYPNDLSIKNLYADYLIAADKLVLALPILDELSLKQPLRGLQAAAIARRLGQENNADRIAKRSLDQMTEMNQEDPTNIAVSLAIAQNQIFLKRFSEATKMLDKAIKLAKTDQEQQLARTAFGDAVVAYVNHIESSSAGDVDRVRVLRMMEEALKRSPKNPRVLTVISNQVLATANDDSEQIKALRQALLQGVSPGVAHFVRGTGALMKGDYDLAERELTLANEHMPLSSAVMNNLAVVMTERWKQDQSIDLEQPLKIIDQAIKSSRTVPPHFHETRGQILILMERYQDAIRDLEVAVAHPELARKAHLDLALCYDKIGDQEMAEGHRQAAADMKAERSGQQEETAASESEPTPPPGESEANSEKAEAEQPAEVGTASDT